MTGRRVSAVESGGALPPSRPGSAPDGVPPPSPSSRGRTALAGRYRSLFVIGKGGMGTVEAALEIEPASEPNASTSGSRPIRERGYERIVALKRLLPDSAHDKRRVDMFLREARLAAMLQHPNVVSAYDYGEIEGELYLAMEYVEGQPLSRVLRALADAGERLPTPVAAWVLAEICRGLHAAHELADPTTGQSLQLVHRDVSPQNVMIGYDGRVRLLDFGVAKIESESVTKTGEVKGKTAYMSPEQAMGDAIDRRSDLFSVGAVLYECLTLRRMWGDGTDMEVIRKLALESPPSLDGAELPKSLCELHARLVAREATERPATADAVAEELMELVDDPERTAAGLRSILEAHFADQAREQEKRLNEALRQVAPDQADELRESMLPSASRISLRMRTAGTRSSGAPAAQVAEPPVPEAPRSPRARVAGVVALAVVALVGWRMLGSTPPAPAEPSVEPSVEPSATPASTATTTEAASSTASAPAPSPPASVVSATSSAIAPTPRPTATPRTIATPRVTPSARPTNSAKPPDIDDKPF